VDYRRLGRSGLEVSVVGIGCNNFGRRLDLDGTAAVLNQAIDEGINLLDTADIYGGEGASEELMGKALEGKRHQVVLATKFAGPMGEGPMSKGTSRNHIIDAVDASLCRLRTDYIDLYQVHFPDKETPMEETMRALDDLVRAGKVRYLGNSNYAGWQIAHAQWIAEHYRMTPFISAQNEWSLLKRAVETEVVPAAQEFGLGVLPYFPLASGLLTGKYKRGAAAPEGTRLAAGPMAERALTDANFDIVEQLETYVQERGHTLLELAFSWLASHPAVGSVIAGATKPEQVTSNAAAASWVLTDEERTEVDQIARR
jgi:aryl-alcohol dehydrogenase-like predicted oxidoreductase